MTLVNAQQDGWEVLRRVVFQRDGRCVATRGDLFGSDVAPDLCKDQFGNIIRPDTLNKLEFEHIKERSAMAKRATDDEAHAVAACPWHHRLSRKWRTDTVTHRRVLRDYLARLYPSVWELPERLPSGRK